MPARKWTVNLLPASDFEASFWGKFLKWATTSGRYIIILTELVVIGAFLSRFKLDEDLSRLNSEIAGKVGVLDANMPLENEFKRQQGRLLAADSVLVNRQEAGEMIDKLLPKIPGEVKLSSLSIEKGDIMVEAVSLTEYKLGELLLRIDRDPQWKSIEVLQVTHEPEIGTKYLVDIKF